MDYATLRARISKERPDLPLSEVDRAYEFSERVHGSEQRLSGEPYMTHPVGILSHLMALRPDITTIQACLLHDVLEDTSVSPVQLEGEFGSEVLRLVEGCRTLSLVKMKQNDSKSELWRQMFLTLAEDVRILMIRLCDRLHNMETLHFVPPEKQKRIAEETLAVHAVVASYLGMYELKNRLQDLSLMALQPEAYARLVRDLETFQAEKADEFVSHAKSQLESLLREAKIPFEEVQGRFKHVYSLHEKMHQKERPDLADILDLFALRVIVPDLPDRPNLSYEVLSLLHHEFLPLEDRFKDYIRLPKANGYRSLHTTLLGIGLPLYDAPTEVQIRTRSMHQEAELGVASHLDYKLRGKGVNLRGVGSRRRRIYVLTPRHDVLDLPEGATPVDFAYRIHSDVGHHLVHAKVNGVIVPLDSVLHNGDQIEVITRPHATPSRTWASFVRSEAVRSKIKAWFLRHDDIHNGMVSHSKDAETESVLDADSTPSPKTFSAVDHVDSVELEGGARMPMVLAQCCQPQPPQSIVAYVTRGVHLKVHRASCRELKRLSVERFLKAHWKAKPSSEVGGTSKQKIRSAKSRSKSNVHPPKV